MANGFSKQVTQAFDEIAKGFEDALIMSKLVETYQTDQQTMERSGDVIWRPQPYIMQTYSGMDQTSNFGDVVQLSVPATIGYQRAAPWKLTAKELRDQLQSGRLVKSAKQRLATDINISIMNVAALEGSLVVKRTVSPTGFDDVAEADAIMNEQGVPMTDRKIALPTRIYNKMASNLAGRESFSGASQTAYEKALIPALVGFTGAKLDYAYSLPAAAGVTVTINGANQRYVPKATNTNADGSLSNVDNRYQTITVSVGSGTVAVGDAFTIDGVFAVHHITKLSTGYLKTFRVKAIVTGAGGSGTISIEPPIIAADSSPTAAESQYKNVTAAPADGAAITFLNTAAAQVAPFWAEDAIEIIPGRLAPDPDSGMAVMRATTESGFEITMTRQGSINDLSTKYRLDVLYGVVNKQPEMSGIMLFNQV